MLNIWELSLQDVTKPGRIRAIKKKTTMRVLCYWFERASTTGPHVSGAGDCLVYLELR